MVSVRQTIQAQTVPTLYTCIFHKFLRGKANKLFSILWKCLYTVSEINSWEKREKQLKRMLIIQLRP